MPEGRFSYRATGHRSRLDRGKRLAMLMDYQTERANAIEGKALNSPAKLRAENISESRKKASNNSANREPN
jgi:hypothetical protein